MKRAAPGGMRPFRRRLLLSWQLLPDLPLQGRSAPVAP